MLQNIDSALCQKVLDAVKDNFVHLIHRPHIGYSKSTMLDLLTYLYATYTVITNAEWLANDNHFHDVYAPTDSTKVVW